VITAGLKRSLSSSAVGSPSAVGLLVRAQYPAERRRVVSLLASRRLGGPVPPPAIQSRFTVKREDPGMWWVVLWTVVTAVGVLGTVVSANSVRFGRRVAQEARELAALSGNAAPVTPSHLSGLPKPVQRYLGKAIGQTSRAVRLVRLRHGGTFRPSLGGSWLPIRGEQHFSASPPGFVWWGRVRIAPGLWIDARDRSVNGLGNMFVTAASTFTLANSSGP